MRDERECAATSATMLLSDGNDIAGSTLLSAVPMRHNYRCSSCDSRQRISCGMTSVCHFQKDIDTDRLDVKIKTRRKDNRRRATTSSRMITRPQHLQRSLIATIAVQCNCGRQAVSAGALVCGKTELMSLNGITPVGRLHISQKAHISAMDSLMGGSSEKCSSSRNISSMGGSLNRY